MSKAVIYNLIITPRKLRISEICKGLGDDLGYTHDDCRSSEWLLSPRMGEERARKNCCECECHYTRESMSRDLGYQVEG